MKPDEITEAIDEISTQLYQLGERYEELRHDVNVLLDKVTRLDYSEGRHEQRLDELERMRRELLR